MTRSPLALLRAGSLAGALAIGLATTLLNPAPVAADEGSYFYQFGKRFELPLAEGYVAIEFENRDPDSVSTTMRRAAEGAEEVGLDVVETRIGPNQMIVRASDAGDATRRLARRSGGPAVRNVRPVFYYNGIKSPEAMVTLADRLVVSLDPGIGLDDRLDIFDRYGLEIAFHIMENTYSVHSPVPAEEIAGLCARIVDENPGLVRWAEPAMHRLVHSLWSTALPAGDDVVDSLAGRGADPLREFQWHLHNTGRNTIGPSFGRADDDIDAPRSWNPNIRTNPNRTTGYFGTTTTRPIVVGVFDSGTDIDHEDYVNYRDDPWNNLPNGNRIARSVLDPRLGYDYINLSPNPRAGLDAHGTAVAGIIASARNNGRGGTGVAPGALIYTLKLTNDEGQYVSNDVFAIAYVDATLAQIDVGNHSYGGLGGSQTENDAFQFAFESGRFGLGMPNFASAGNSTTFMSFPALYEWTYSVGGVDDRGQKVSYASYSGLLDFTGPTAEFGRAGIVTTDISGPAGYNPSNPASLIDPNGNYAFDFNGTSASGPVIAGVAALILAEYPSIPLSPQLPRLQIGGGAFNLFELIALTADRPPVAENYFPTFSNAALMTFVQATSEEGQVTTNTVRMTFNNPTLARRAGGYRVDGFNYLFGYGRPNPARAVTLDFADSPYRDYRNVNINDTEEEDFGELRLVYSSNFRRDYENLLIECANEIAGEEGDPFEVPLEEAEACVRTKINNPLSDWRFNSIVTRGCDPGDDDPGQQELHFFSTAQLGQPIEFEFDLAPDSESSPTNVALPIRRILDRVDSNPIPYVIHAAIPAADPDDDDEFWYNPRGRMRSNQSYQVSANVGGAGAIPIPEDSRGLPLVVEVTLKHDFGIYDATSVRAAVFRANDVMSVVANGTTIGTIIGSSHNAPIFPPFAPDTDEEETEDCGDQLTRIFPGSLGVYIPPQELFPLYFRTYRFVVPPVTGPQMSLQFNLQTSSAYYPEYDTADEPGQIFTIQRRATRAFQIADVKVWALDHEPDPVTILDGKQIHDPDAVRVTSLGTRPQWSASGREIIYATTNDSGMVAQVRTASSERVNRRAAVANRDPIVIERPSLRLFDLCQHRITVPGICSGTARLLSLDTDAAQTSLVYVADNPPNQPRVFLVTDDGFDEYPLYPFDPETMTEPLDRGVTEAAFTPLSGDIMLTNGAAIFIVQRDGSFPEFVIDTATDKLVNFRHMSMDFAESLVAFTATNRQNDDGIYFAIRQANLPGTTGSTRMIADWPASHEREGAFSPAGDRFAFVSNALAMGGGTPPPGNAPYRLYIMDNARDVVFYNAEPTIRSVSMLRDVRLTPGQSETFQAAAFPSFSPNGLRMAFVGKLDSTQNLGEITLIDVPPAGGCPVLLQPASSPLIPSQGTTEAFLISTQSDCDWQIQVNVPWITVMPPLSGTDNQLVEYIVAPNTGIARDGLIRVNNANFWVSQASGILPSPTPTPFPSPTPEPTEGTVQIGQFQFDAAGDGWQFRTVNFLHPAVGTIEADGLAIRANNNNELAYGFFVSPVTALSLFPNNFDSPSGQGPLYLLRYYIRRLNPVADQAAILRLRVNSLNLQDYHLLDVQPFRNAELIPDDESLTAVDLLFQPSQMMYSLPLSERTYAMAFDLINTLDTSDPNAGYRLERLDVYRIPQSSITTQATFATYDFASESQRNDWEFHNLVPRFDSPEFSVGPARLEMVAPQPDNVYGQWQNKPDRLVISPLGVPGTGKMFVRATWTAGAEETNRINVPEMRFRISEGDYAAVAMHGVVSLDTPGNFPPTAGNNRTYRTFLEVDDQRFAEMYIIAAWDILAFALGGDSTPASAEKVFLDGVTFDFIRIADYPAVDPNP